MREETPAIWLFGPLGAGKSTLARAAAAAWPGAGEVLDEDAAEGPAGTGGKVSRDALAKAELRAASDALALQRAGKGVVLARTSPWREPRVKAWSRLPGVFSVYLSCPLQVRVNRDESGLYQRALAGGLPGLPGLDAPFEKPAKGALVLDTARQTPAQALAELGRALWGRDGPEGRGKTAAPSMDQMVLERLADLGYI